MHSNNINVRTNNTVFRCADSILNCIKPSQLNNNHYPTLPSQKMLPISPAETNVGSGIYQGSGTGNMAPYARLMKRANVVYSQHIHTVTLRTD